LRRGSYREEASFLPVGVFTQPFPKWKRMSFPFPVGPSFLTLDFVFFCSLLLRCYSPRDKDGRLLLFKRVSRLGDKVAFFAAGLNDSSSRCFPSETFAYQEIPPLHRLSLPPFLGPFSYSPKRFFPYLGAKQTFSHIHAFFPHVLFPPPIADQPIMPS